MRFVAFSIAVLLVSACKPTATEPAAAATPIVPGPPGSVQGTVVESLSAASYSYLRLSTDAGEQWVAVPNTEIPVGTHVTVLDPLEMTNFESKALERTFERVLFGTLMGEADQGRPTAHVDATADSGAVDAGTIAAIYADRASWENERITVTGEVVKFTPDVMDRNWIHLRDGSGSEEAKDNDLTFTTSERVTVGATVTMTGVLRLEKDFGAGYSYALIVEDAHVAK